MKKVVISSTPLMFKGKNFLVKDSKLAVIPANVPASSTTRTPPCPRTTKQISNSLTVLETMSRIGKDAPKISLKHNKSLPFNL